MSRSPDVALRGLLSLVPSGAAWSTDEGSVLARTLTPLANEIAVFEAQAEAQLAECDPLSSVLLIENWERLLGPDPCLPDPATQTLPQRQATARWRYTDRGGCSIAYFQALAATFGYSAAITEYVRSSCGQAQCGDELIPDGGQFVWDVVLTPGPGTPALSEGQVACLIATRAPAHTVPTIEVA